MSPLRVDAHDDALKRRAEPASTAGVDHDLAADIVARMLDTADGVRREVVEGDLGCLALLLADAAFLSRVLVAGWSREDLEQLAGRLWMVAR